MSEPTLQPPPHMTARGAIGIGVGAMVGAGIFALLGQAAVFAGAAVWVSFLIAGLISAALGYTLVKFAIRFPSSGGLVAYIMHGYSSKRLLGVTAWLGYLAAILVVGAMVARSFGDYAAAAIADAPQGGALSNVCSVVLVLAAGLLAAKGPRLIDRAQSLIVGLLLIVFTVFVVATLPDVDPALLAPSGYPPAGDIVSSVALTFFAFLGFGTITFVAGDLRRPRRDLPIAVYGALAITAALYIAVAFAVFGTLTVDEVIEAGPLALAVAAEPSLGQFGHTMMTIAALLATASSVTAILYGSVGLTAALADAGAFPPLLGSKGRLGRHGGLAITTVLMALFAAVLSIEALASVGSAVSLAVFVLVAVAAFRLRRELQASATLTAVAAIASGIVLAWFVIDLFTHQPRSFLALAVLTVLAVIVDEVWMRRRARTAPTS